MSKINSLAEYIETLTGATRIEEGDIVVDSAYALNPFGTSGLQGNGDVLESNLHCRLELLYVDSDEAISNGEKIWKALKNKKYGCTAPEYSFDKTGKIWKASMNVTLLGGKNGRK